jgi:hypothetical protein
MVADVNIIIMVGILLLMGYLLSKLFEEQRVMKKFIAKMWNILSALQMIEKLEKAREAKIAENNKKESSGVGGPAQDKKVL